MTRLDVAMLDRQRAWCLEEAKKLRLHNGSAAWARTKAEMLDGIAESLRVMRQDQQMAGMSGDLRASQ